MPSRERSSYIPSIIKESFQGISRNALISLAAGFSIIAALLILGIFLVFTANVNALTQVAEDNLEIQIFLKEGISQEQKDNLYQTLLDDPLVSSIIFESKEEALENFTESLNDYNGLLSEYDSSNNPLPESYIVKAYNTDDLIELRDLANSFTEEVEYVKYEENYISSLTSFTSFVNIFSFILLIVMSLIALFLIYNTIRLTVANRKKEIEIMKYIGATDTFIQLPFVLEGTFLGIISAIISVLLVCMVYYYLIGYLNGSIFFTFRDAIVTPGSILFVVFLCFIAYGIIIGSLGAIIATRKYLDV